MVRFVYQETDGFCVFEQSPHQLRHQTGTDVFPAAVFAQPNAFEIDNFGSLRNDVCFESQNTILHDDPCSSLFDTSKTTFTETLRIDLQRVDSTFSESELRLNGHHQVQLCYGGRSQALDRSARFDGPTQLKQPFATR
jgi:hypothetical protein